MDLLDRMLGHDEWATNQLFDFCLGMTDEQLEQPIDVGLQTISDTFDHINLNIEFWTAFMIGQPIDYRPRRRSLPEQIERHKTAYATFAALSRQFRDEDRMDDNYIDHYDVKKSMGGTIIHVVLHNAEHRTEILHILGRIGFSDLPEVDHGLWDYLLLKPDSPISLNP